MEKMKVALSIIAAALLTVAISSYWFRIKQNKEKTKKKGRSSICYLERESSKPQEKFKVVLADNSYSQFKHLNVNEHPFKEQIEQILATEPQLLASGFSFFDGTLQEDSIEFLWVDTQPQLELLADVLSKQIVFAVDTEQHSLRSFLGFTALIQISTKQQDYLLDSIALHDHIGILTPIFANPAITKVFHGADNDVLWLQRDFHIYVVNLFDTAKACDVLSKPQRSLAYLLHSYCGVSKNKLLQREDWRQRPLPAEMLQYASTDSHYLLYIAQCLSSELKQKDSETPLCPDDKSHFLLEASRRSNSTCLQLFSKEVEEYPGESAASSIVYHHLSDQDSLLSSSSESQFQDLVRRICAWRDIMARVHDESLRYVLSEQEITAIATKGAATGIKIYDTVSEVDLNADSTCVYFIQTQSPVFCSHLIDFEELLQGKASSHDDIFQMIFEGHLGSTRTCPISLFNYSLLSKGSLQLTSRSAPKINGSKAVKQGGRKSSRQLFVQKFSCKSPVYHNCKIYANDGRLLCHCDRKKLEWYLNRDLAKLVEDEPLAIMLLFEPKGRPEDEGNDFYIQSKKNICVGCGEGNHYLRYRIIPSCYRMHFPEQLKSHRSHDIVLLCVDCHEVAHAAAEKYKRLIAKEFQIPLYIHHVLNSNEPEKTSGLPASSRNDEVGVSPLHLRAAAMALLHHGQTMPSKRRKELTQIVMKYYGGREICEHDLEQALFVGMTPLERRRFMKKRGLPTIQITSNARNEKNVSPTRDVRISGTQLQYGGGRESAVCRTETDIPPHVVSESVDSENGNLSNGTKNTNASAKNNSKFSLLGHGAHGKQVVDSLLKEHGEEGIREFCQRWRQIFVDSLHPRFLPAGWDVQHRI
ncbi:hypothetical protein Leryth_010093 [Lithospermum erythrorhizon]|nr:hypothetical protein Leryth_010093 [Lithospermum erythrorhizon]